MRTKKTCATCTTFDFGAYEAAWDAVGADCSCCGNAGLVWPWSTDAKIDPNPWRCDCPAGQMLPRHGMADLLAALMTGAAG